MDSILDSETWADEVHPAVQARRVGWVWLRRGLLLLCTVAALGVLLAR
ncbi:MAG: hypothetical protein Q8O29_13950 [Polaromonas sp.]|nr:hypothetical protein [Polaromonas sp.]